MKILSMREEYAIIINHYGVKNQKNKAIEELGELQIALINNDYENIIEEIADVWNMLNQLSIIYGIGAYETAPTNNSSIENIQYSKDEFIKELSFLERRIAQDFMGSFNREKMVHSISMVKQKITDYGDLNNIQWVDVFNIMEQKNHRTLKQIEEIAERIKTIESWKGEDM